MTDISAWLIRQAQQWEDQHAPQHLAIGLREAADEIARLREALLCGVLMLSEMGLSANEKCELAYNHLSAALTPSQEKQ